MSNDSTTSNEPCGSWRAVKIIEGMYAEQRWCERTDGPCPFPGTVPDQQSERRCATEPGTTLRVSWAKASMRAILESAPRVEPDPPELLQRRIDALIDERFVQCGWRLVTTAGLVSLRSDRDRPSAWGGRGHPIFVRRVEPFVDPESGDSGDTTQ